MNSEYSVRKEGQRMRHYISQIADNFGWKLVLSVGGAIIAAMGNFYSDLLWWFMLMFGLDLATGLLKSKRNRVPITSRRLRDSVYKLGGYMFLITALIVASKFQVEFTALVTLSYYYFMLTELKSIFENVQEMGVKVPSFLTTLVNLKLKNVVSHANKLLNKPKEEDKSDRDSTANR